MKFSKDLVKVSCEATLYKTTARDGVSHFLSRDFCS